MQRRSVRRNVVAGAAVVALVAATFYPSNIERDYAVSRHGHDDPLVQTTENYTRHANVVLPLALAVGARDLKGLGQIFLVAAGTAVATRGQKYLLNDVTVGGTRLGQRPLPTNRPHNMPSGHSSTAAAGAYFTMKRYSIWWGAVVIPVTLLTMYARVMLDAHTVSATIAGALTGLLATWALMSERMPWVRAYRIHSAKKHLYRDGDQVAGANQFIEMGRDKG